MAHDELVISLLFSLHLICKWLIVFILSKFNNAQSNILQNSAKRHSYVVPAVHRHPCNIAGLMAAVNTVDQDASTGFLEMGSIRNNHWRIQINIQVRTHYLVNS